MSDLDIDQPNTYRIYDYLLGGSFNFAADRAFAHELLARVPWAREVARHNRGFLARAIRYAVGRGVRQFLDLGSGIPTVSRTDQIAIAADPRCRVAYVDTNQLAIAHAEVLLNGHKQVANRAAVPSGSLLAMSHATYDGVPPEVAAAAPMYRSAAEPMYDRSRPEITALFRGWHLIPPGVVFTGEWRPAHPDEILAEPNRSVFLAGAAVKP